MPAHSRQPTRQPARPLAARQPLTSRPTTVVTLGMAVSALLVATLVHAPARADASPAFTGEITTRAIGDSTGSTSNAGSPTFSDIGQTRLVRLVDIRQERMQRRHERAVQQARRQERRADARAAARAAARAPQWVMPVPGAGWSASYGESGSSWSSGYHTGQDFTAVSGTPVLAVSAGSITSASWSDAYGNIIEITHPSGDQSWYAHMSGFERTSGSVSAGDVIGYVGCTGNCYGDHLHFEYHPGGGEAADPIAWLHRNGL